MIIYKYELKQDPSTYQEIEIPEYSTPLYVGQQDHILYVWCMVINKSNPIEKKRFYVMGTGIDYSRMDARDQVSIKYIGTVQMGVALPGHLVWHVYYKE
jgi:hypothetical protein